MAAENHRVKTIQKSLNLVFITFAVLILKKNETFITDFQTAWKVGNSVAGWVMIICLSNHRASREYGKQQHAIFKLKEESCALPPLRLNGS